MLCRFHLRHARYSWLGWASIHECYHRRAVPRANHGQTLFWVCCEDAARHCDGVCFRGRSRLCHLAAPPQLTSLRRGEGKEPAPILTQRHDDRARVVRAGVGIGRRGCVRGRLGDTLRPRRPTHHFGINDVRCNGVLQRTLPTNARCFAVACSFVVIVAKSGRWPFVLDRFRHIQY